MSVLSGRYFHCEEGAFEHLESFVWANGVTCPHCGSISGKHYDLRKTRLGLRKCSYCRKQFTSEGRHRLRERPYPAQQDVTGRLSDVRVKEDYQRSPASPRPWCHLQVCMVPLPSLLC